MTASDLHSDLQKLIDARFDAIDRVLMRAQISWSERRSIVGEVETQIFELLARRTPNPTQEDVLAVLDSLDPPESYIPEEFREGPAVAPAEGSSPPLQWRELQRRVLRHAANFSSGALHVVALLTINGIAILLIVASDGGIQWLVTLGILAWLNYEGLRRFRAWSAARSGRMLDDVRHALAAWLLPKNGAPAA